MTTDKNAFMSSISGRVAVIMILISAGAWITDFSEVRELLSSNALLAAESLAPPPTYEYQSIGVSPYIDSLNEKGKEGWRLLPIETTNTHGDTTYYCERETTPGTPKITYEYKSASADSIKLYGVESRMSGFESGPGRIVNTGRWRVRVAVRMAPKRNDYFIMERELD